MTGCGSDKVTITTPSPKSTELTEANLDMALASTTEAAKKEADVFAKYNPPASAQEAIDHFVGTEGPQLTDPDYDEYDKALTAWVKAACP